MAGKLATRPDFGKQDGVGKMIRRITMGAIGLYLAAVPCYVGAVTPDPLPAGAGWMLVGIMVAGLCGILAAAIDNGE